MKVDKNSTAWGVGVLVIYAAAMGVLLYIYYQDSKRENAKWDGLRNKLSDTLGGVSENLTNGKTHVSPTDLVQNTRPDPIP